ncbi:gdp-mannose 4 [Quercus suber]|uniref:GDP-mannose 4,6-dehydratase n=1 Tax=Quercus suber TaxID=58331 RepID=A0AAW0LXF3_QUESU
MVIPFKFKSSSSVKLYLPVQIAMEDSHTVEEFLQVAFGYVGLNWKDHVVIDKRYFRPTEVDNLKGDASRVKKVLDWKP